MKKGIHPKYEEAEVICGCGNRWKTRSTKKRITIEVCSKCHPFFSGQEKYIDSTGRVERFKRRHSWDESSLKNKMKKDKEEGKDKSKEKK